MLQRTEMRRCTDAQTLTTRHGDQARCMCTNVKVGAPFSFSELDSIIQVGSVARCSDLGYGADEHDMFQGPLFLMLWPVILFCCRALVCARGGMRLARSTMTFSNSVFEIVDIAKLYLDDCAER